MVLDSGGIVSVKLKPQIREVVFSPLLIAKRSEEAKGKVFQQPKSIFTEKDDLF
ncbi:MAG: hypothetical protein KGH54_00700 [Candidatus Micrarchaeota archaeon]|nr:hypothetical protein [Candidatus Micrarchaeota archaeon]